MELIRVSNLEKKYKNGVTALYDFDLRVKKGDFLFVIGTSGSGKSTLIKLLYREEKPSKGSIIVGGIDVSKLRSRKVYKLRRKLGIVFQDFKLLSKLTVFENVAFSLRVIGAKNTIIKKEVNEILNIIGLSHKKTTNPHLLSGGEQQKLCIARAIVSHPLILLTDEPTGNLDPETSWEIMKLLFKINVWGTTVVVASHDKLMVDKAQKRVIRLEQGEVVSDTKKGIYSQ